MEIPEMYYFLDVKDLSSKEILRLEKILGVPVAPPSHVTQEPNRSTIKHEASTGLNAGAKEFVPAVNSVQDKEPQTKKPSFADLLKSGRPQTVDAALKKDAPVGPAPSPPSQETLQKKLKIFFYDDPFIKASNTEPRGMVNKGNECYMASALQVLMAVPEIPGLFKKLGECFHPDILDRELPFSATMMRFVQAYEHQNGNKTLSALENPFTQLLKLLGNSAMKEGQQADTCEFLSCIIGKFESELTVSDNVLNTDKPAGDDDDAGWQQVKRRGARRLKQQAQNPIRNLFGGTTIEVTETVGSKEKLSNRVPFKELVLPFVDLAETSIDTSLDFHFRGSVVEWLEEKTGKMRSKTCRLVIDELPSLLYINCANTTRESSGASRESKPLTFSDKLHLQDKWLSESARQRVKEGSINYQLIGCIFHKGQSNQRGHYVAFTYHWPLSQWWFTNDDLVKTVKVKDVLEFSSTHPDTVPHCLLYRKVQSNSSRHPHNR